MSLPIQNHYTFPNIGDIANLIQGGVNLVSGLNTESTDMAVSDFELVKPTLNGLVHYVYEAVAQAFVAVISFCTQSFNASSPEFYNLIGCGADTYNASVFNVFYWAGILLLLGIFIYSIWVVTLGPIADQKNDFIELIVRFLGSLILICSLKQILGLINEIETEIAVRMSNSLSQSIYELSGNLNIDLESLVEAGISTILIELILIIVWIAVIIEFVKFMLEITERYLVVQLLTFSSPTVGSFWCSRTTSSILGNFIRMYIAQIFLLLMNNFYLYISGMMIASVLATGNSDIRDIFIILVTLKCAQRLDSYMKSMGLSVAQTGGVLYSSLIGAAASMGALLRAGKNGANLTGSILEAAGAKSGNYGMASVGTKMKMLGHGDFGNANSKSLDSFASGGGFGNIDRSNAKQVMTAEAGLQKALANADYRRFMAAPADMQTKAIKTALMQNGDALAQATGGLLSANDIQQARINKYGDIAGTIRHKDANGKEFTSSFKATISPNGSELKNGAKIANIGDGADRTLTLSADTTPISNLEGTINNDGYGLEQNFHSLSEGQISKVSSLYGIETDNQTLSKLGVVGSRTLGDTVTYYDEGNQVRAYQNIENGNFTSLGTAQTELSTDISTYMNDNQYTQYMPSDSNITGGINYNKENGKVNAVSFDVSSNESGGNSIYTVNIRQPEPQDLRDNARGHIVHDDVNGDRHITVVKKTQSFTNASK